MPVKLHACHAMSCHQAACPSDASRCAIPCHANPSRLHGMALATLAPAPPAMPRHAMPHAWHTCSVASSHSMARTLCLAMPCHDNTAVPCHACHAVTMPCYAHPLPTSAPDVSALLQSASAARPRSWRATLGQRRLIFWCQRQAASVHWSSATWSTCGGRCKCDLSMRVMSESRQGVTAAQWEPGQCGTEGCDAQTHPPICRRSWRRQPGGRHSHAWLVRAGWPHNCVLLHTSCAMHRTCTPSSLPTSGTF